MAVSPQSGARRVDGRTARSQRTRDSIVDALFALLDEGMPAPTVHEIADRAGVSSRTIFQHFHDRELLFAELSARQAERVRPMMRRVPADGPLEERVDAIVEQRRRVYELISPMRRSAVLTAPFSDTTERALADFRAYKRRDLARVFAAEIEARPAKQRACLAAALGAAGSWSHWEALRTEQGLSEKQAAGALRRTLLALLTTPGDG